MIIFFADVPEWFRSLPWWSPLGLNALPYYSSEFMIFIIYWLADVDHKTIGNREQMLHGHKPLVLDGEVIEDAEFTREQ